MIEKQLFQLVKGKKGFLAVLTVLNLLQLVCSIGGTYFLCVALEKIVAGQGLAACVPAFLWALAAMVAKFVLSKCTTYTASALGNSVKTRLRDETYQKIIRLGKAETTDLNTAGLTQASLEGIEQLELYFTAYLPQLFYALIAPFGLFALCLWLNNATAWVLLAGVPLIPISMMAISRFAKKVFHKYWDKYQSMGNAFLDNIQGMKELKIFQADEAKHAEMANSAEDFRGITMKVLVMQLWSVTIMDLVAYGGAAVAIVVSVAAAINHAISPMTALFLSFIAAEFYIPLRILGNAFHISMNGVTAGKKILRLLNEPEPIWGDTPAEYGDIRFENVSFGYDGTNVLSDVSLTIPKNSYTAIVGESGSGKSTVAELAEGVLHGYTGRITVNGVPLTELNRHSYYEKCAFVGCESHIFSDTVRNNFKMANPSVTDEEIYCALKQVNLLDFVMQNGGADMKIDEDGTNISGGQKQRLLLAINLTGKKSFFLLDEATSNIDAESESILMDSIRGLAKDKNVLVISHRLQNVTDAANIYVLDEGTVKEQGTHAELMAKNGLYKKMYDLQFLAEQGYKEVPHA